jgi:hypothetical protein
VLVDENGLNDLSRVTVELGKGEVSTIPEEDGVVFLKRTTSGVLVVILW